MATNKTITGIVFFCFCLSSVYSQWPLQKQWDYRYGGTSAEVLNTFKITQDSGFILGGYTDSDSTGDVSQHTQGNTDFWVVKTGSNGLKQWDKRFGGLDSERLFAIQQTTDGGYIFGGYTESDSTGDVSQPTRGNADYWVVKTDAAGNKQWDKRFGGLYSEYLNALVQTSDGGYLLAGQSFSDSTGDFSHYNNGGMDFWVVKINAAGSKQWDNNYGGYQDEMLYDVKITLDGNYVLCGSTLSDSTGSMTQHSRGGYDYWIVKIDTSGTKLWDKRFGGTQNDFASSLIVTNDGGVLAGGYSESDSTGDVSQHTKGMADYWLVKTNTAGIKQWDKRYGGDWNETVFGNLSKSFDGNYLVSGLSYSYMSGDKTEDNLGVEEPWVLKIDTNGTKVWDKTIFTSGHEEQGLLLQCPDSGYAVALYTSVDVGGYKTQPSQGYYDFWFVKFNDTSAVSSIEDMQSGSFNLKLFPNPSNERMLVKLSNPAGEEVSLNIYNTMGELILTQKINSTAIIQTKNFPNGIYFLQATSIKQHTRIKFVVKH